jgi:hypothetical protein
MAEAERASTVPGAGRGPAASEPRRSVEELRSWRGLRLDEMTGSGAGSVRGVYVDARTGEPIWLLARMGLFGHFCLVPARHAVAAAKRVWVPYTRETMRSAPRIEPGEDLLVERERELLRHYGAAGGKRDSELERRASDEISCYPV